MSVMRTLGIGHRYELMMNLRFFFLLAFNWLLVTEFTMHLGNGLAIQVAGWFLVDNIHKILYL